MTTPESTSARLRIAIARLARLMRQDSATSLTPSQNMALATLLEHAPMRLSEFAAIENISLPAATRLLGSLDELGFVLKETDLVDRRAQLVRLSNAGADFVVSLRSMRDARLDARISDLTDTQLQALLAGLEVLEQLA